MKRRRGREGDALPPTGWTRILPSQHAGGISGAHSGASSPSSSGSSPGTNRGPDALGLARAHAPTALLRRELRVREHLHAAASSGTAPSRHQKLSNQHRTASRRDVDPREAFSPQHSLRLASLQRPRSSDDEDAQRATPAASPNAGMDRLGTHSSGAREQQLCGDLPLHELIRTVDDAVAADPSAASSQAAVTAAFMAQWLARYDASRHQYKSVGACLSV